MRNLSLVVFTLLIFPFISFAQTAPSGGWCGTEYPEYMFEYVEDAMQDFQNGIRKSGQEYDIPVTLHNMRNTDGTGGGNIQQTLQMFCDIAAAFEPYDMNMYLNSIEQHDNTAWTLDGAIAATAFLTRVPNTVNMYLFPQLTGGAGLCGYYRGSATAPNQTEIMGVDVIAINTNSFCGDNVGVLVHEIGHYFGLPHTFFTFEGTGSNCGVYVSNGERVDGSNCSTVTDRICDTPPDNNANATLPCPNGQSCLQYDRDSVAFNPDPTIYMSYFLDCISRFTEGQNMVMINILENLREDLLVLPPPTNLQPVTQTANLVLPEEGVNRPYDEVYFNWAPVPNATTYYFEISRSSSFNALFRVENTFVDINQYTSTVLEPSQTYYWRVIAYNESHTCVSEYSSSTFNTLAWTVANEQVEGVESINISPNPAFSGQAVTLQLESTKQLDGTLNVYNVNGQSVHQAPISISASNNSFSIDTQKFAAGLYVVHLQFGAGTIQRKFIVN